MKELETSCFETRPTADKLEDVCVLWVPEKQIKAGLVRTARTTLNEFMPTTLKDDARVRGYEGYLYTANTDSAPSGYRGFIFSKPKTRRQREKPYQTETTFMDIEWPDMIENVQGVEGEMTYESLAGKYDNVGTSNTVTRTVFQDGYELTPGGVLPTLVRIEKSQSPKEFTGLFCTVCRGDNVRWNYRDAQASLTGLHGDITVPSRLTSTRRVAEFGETGARDLPGGQFFPRTRMRKWQPYVYRDGQSLNPQTGMYERTRIVILAPPPRPRAQRPA